MTPATLPRFLRLNDARATKQALFASLSPFQIEILDTAAHPHGHVFGGKGCPALVISKGKDDRVVENGMPDVHTLVRTGWLRFAPQVGVGKDGYFWLTDSAERLWKVLGRAH